ncbi:MAG: hypothetical protein PWR04_624 [Anaerophaga sp.]|nr:hypothetical protein [Anaerophaga sp.]
MELALLILYINFCDKPCHARFILNLISKNLIIY